MFAELHPQMSSFHTLLPRSLFTPLEINSSLIPRWHIHNHSFPCIQMIIQIFSLFQHKCVNSLENMSTANRKGKYPKHFFHSAVFLFSSLLCSAKKEDTRKNNNKTKTINRFPPLYISLFMYVHIDLNADLSLHEHTALGPALPHGRGLVHLFSPTGQRRQWELRDSLQTSAGTAAF